MKKLMVMLSAAAMSFGLFAADEGFKAGDGFESATAESAFTPSDPWSQGGSTAGTYTVKAYGTGEAYGKDVPAQYADDEANNNYLKVATTFGNPLLLNVPTADQTVGDGLYFDSLVKFTACDYEDDPTYTDAKLLVYLKETDAEGTETHLYVKAGQMTGVSTVAPAVYDCGAWSKGDDWVRLTVRAINDATDGELVPAFVVFVDGEPIGTQTAVGDAAFVAALTPAAADWNLKLGVHSLFPSLSVGEAAKVVSVGFDGQGSIDDVAVTTTQPTFAKDSDFLTITWDPAQVDVTVEGEPVSGGTYNHPFTGSMTDPQTVTVVATAKEGYAITGTEGTGCSYEGDTVTIPAESFTPTLAIASKLNKPVMSITIDDDPAGTPSSFADAVAIINDNGICEGAVIRISLTDDVTVGVEDDYSEAYINSKGIVTLDLAGKTITGEGETTMDSVISANSPLTIIDTVGGGKICIAEDSSFNGAVYAAANLTIGNTDTDKGATFDALVDAYADSNIIKGFFAQESMEGLTIAEGSECSAEKIEGYWVVAPIAKATVIFICEKPAYNKSVEVTVGETVKVPEDFPAFVKVGSWGVYPAMTPWNFEDPVDGDMTLSATSIDIALEQDEVDNYLVDDKDDLVTLQQFVAAGCDTTGKTFKQTAAIENVGAFDGIGEVKKGEPSKSDPISGDYSFKGTYDGQGNVITGIVIPNDKTYRGALFNTLVGPATVKNVDIMATLNATGASDDYGAAVIAGSVQGEVTFENCTARGTLTGCHNTAGIACKLTAYNGTPTLTACTNEATIVNNLTENPKAGGIAALAEGATLTDCYNKGNVTVTYGGGVSDSAGGAVAGLIAYAQNAKLTVSGCGNEGTIAKGEQKVDAETTYPVYVGSIIGRITTSSDISGVFAQDTVLFIGSSTDARDGANFATVANGVATGIADAEVVEAAAAADATYKVMSPIATFAYQFTGDAGEIAFLTGLKAPTFTITDKSGNAVDPTAIEGGVKYVVAAAPETPEVAPGGAPAQVTAESPTEAESKVIVKATSPDADVISNEDYAKYYKAKATLVEGKTYSVTVVLDPEKVEFPTTEAAFDAEIGDFAADADATGITVTNAKPGLFYYVEEARKLETGLAEADRDRAMAGKDGNVTVPMTKFDGSGFYQLKVSDIQKGVVR